METHIADARNGDEAAERIVFQWLHVRFKYLAKRIIGDERHEEIAQEACVTVFEKYRTESFKVSFESWAFGVLKMKIGNYLRRQKRRSPLHTPLDENIRHENYSCPDPELRATIVRCLESIAKSFPRYARVIDLNYRGFTTSEICEELRIKPGNFYVLLQRGRDVFRRCLDNGGPSS